ncbi:hypothetical protein [Mesorhizobium sp. INR15]|uniref:hypothetical protein n=1 Tax=Mesorhizobium sp. INR15 TaxID=2654248 RepID=UPI001896A4F1|nr:hypothetical protein [Mesorhizobium sp. INR15]QPC93137.1 hypothetical protein GA829_22635 [Mesorhizobium sp. INR15]
MRKDDVVGDRDPLGRKASRASADGAACGSARKIDTATMRAVSPLPPPEEVFIDWLMSLPHGASIERAARRQIALIDQRVSLHPDVQCLRTLLVAVAGATHWQRPVSNL